MKRKDDLATGAAIIERFLDNQGSDYEWDDWISIEQDDPLMDKARTACSEVGFRFPKGRSYCSEEGEQALAALAKALNEGREAAEKWIRETFPESDSTKQP